MPELPEVETTCRGIAPHINNQVIADIVIRQPRLRWPIPDHLKHTLQQKTIVSVQRRAKYILIGTNSQESLLIHLGMSGSLRIVNAESAIKKHDHVDFIFANGTILRYNDPRRFGAILLNNESEQHPLLKHLGPEPLSDAFDGDYLYQRALNKKIAIKSWIMDAHTVVGVGNIYANESLFLSQIHPNRPAGNVTQEQYQQLALHIKQVLQNAIHQGGTTLRDFVNEQGKPGYFQQSLHVYGRLDAPCKICGHLIQRLKIGQRASYFCPHCQPEIV
jgi:formamidopyrimidine-DNA glycosylase